MGELYRINSRFCKALIARQEESPVVEQIGDIFASFVSEFTAYIEYGGSQAYSKWLLNEEKSINPEFTDFIKVFHMLLIFRNANEIHSVVNYLWKVSWADLQPDWAGILYF
jgi:hypothetical protein